MDVLEEELIRLWRTLNDCGVRYIMVGGFATRFHGFNRTTDDLDMWLEDTLDNGKRLRKAFVLLAHFGAHTVNKVFAVILRLNSVSGDEIYDAYKFYYPITCRFESRSDAERSTRIPVDLN